VGFLGGGVVWGGVGGWWLWVWGFVVVWGGVFMVLCLGVLLCWGWVNEVGGLLVVLMVFCGGWLGVFVWVYGGW